MSEFVQVFGRRRRRDYPHAQAAGVQKASKHEVAGRWAAAGRERYGDFSLASHPNGPVEAQACGEAPACLDAGSGPREREKRLRRRLKGIDGRRAHRWP